MNYDEVDCRRRELDIEWTDLTYLRRAATALQISLRDAGLTIEALSAAMIVESLGARIKRISEQLRQMGSDQPV